MKKYKYKGEVVTRYDDHVNESSKVNKYVIGGVFIRQSDKAVLFLDESEVEEVVELKRYSYGDILYHETDSFKWVFIFTYMCDSQYEGLSCVCVDDGDYYESYRNTATLDIRIATPAEQQLLFSALAKEGKYWDAEALLVKDFERVPENVGIYECIGNLRSKSVYDKGDGLYIAFNDGKQLLSTSDATYHIQPYNDNWFEKVQCYLQPIQRQDIKIGDTIFASTHDDFTRADHYYKKVDGSEYGFARVSNEDIRKVGFQEDIDIKFYKLIPIQ